MRVKSHGRDPDGHSVERDGHRFISLSVKMAPGDRVAGLNRFKLIVGENLVETQQLVMTAAREAHVLVQDHRLVRVQIKDWGEQLFYFTNLLDDEYAETAGQASLRTVTYDYPDDAKTDKALVYTDSPHYRDNIFGFPEHFQAGLDPDGGAPRRLGSVAPPVQRVLHRDQRRRRRRPGGFLRPRISGTVRGHPLRSWSGWARVRPGQPACLPEHGERQVLSRARS